MKKTNVPQEANSPAGKKNMHAVAGAADAVSRKEADAVMVIGFSVLLLLTMTVQTGRMSVILTFLARAACVGKGPVRAFGARLCLPVAGLLGFAVMQGLAAIYSPFDNSALAEFYKFSAAFALVVILLARYEKRHVRGLLWGFACVAAFVAVISVDAVGGGWLFRTFKTVTESMGGEFSSLEQYVGSFRVAGIYNDANVTASLFALGGTAALYLLHTASGRKEQILSAGLSGILGMAFFLSVSRGAMLCLALAWVIWLIAEPADRRGELFLRITATVVSVGALSVIALRENSQSHLPLLLVLVGGVPLFLLELGIRPAANVLKTRRKLVLAGVGVLAVAAVCCGVAAMKLTGPVRFDSAEETLRCIPLEQGAYSLTSESEGPSITAHIYSRTAHQALMKTETVLYSGPLDEAAFTVTDDDAEVFFRFIGKPGAVLYSAALSDGQTIPMAYRLLPGVLANRLQGNLLRNSSFLLRVQYMKDALKLSAAKPLFGYGLGSTENLYSAVQPFWYESVYVHNHVLQYLSDTGAVGALFFVLLMGGVLWLLLRSRKRESSSLAAMLIACWVMMNVHSLMEINFSIRGYLCFALVLTALSVLLYGEPVFVKSGKRVKVIAVAILGAVMVHLAVFGGLMVSHRTVSEASASFSAPTLSGYMEAWRGYIRKDVFANHQYKLNFVGNAVIAESGQYRQDMERWAEDLRKSGTYTNCSGLARYYYLPRGEYEEMFACSREGIAQVAASDDGWNLQLNFYRTEVLPAIRPEHMAVYVDGVLALRDCLAEYSEGRLEEIELTPENEAFLEAVSAAEKNGTPLTELYAQLIAPAAG